MIHEPEKWLQEGHLGDDFSDDLSITREQLALAPGSRLDDTVRELYDWGEIIHNSNSWEPHFYSFLIHANLTMGHQL